MPILWAPASIIRNGICQSQGVLISSLNNYVFNNNTTNVYYKLMFGVSTMTIYLYVKFVMDQWIRPKFALWIKAGDGLEPERGFGARTPPPPPPPYDNFASHTNIT